MGQNRELLLEKIFKSDESINLQLLDLATVREACEYIDREAHNEPLQAVEYSSRLWFLVKNFSSSCIRAEVLGAQASAHRQIEQHGEAAENLAAAESICSCRQCLPRIRRRQAGLYISLGNGVEALRCAEEAVEGARQIMDPVLFGRALPFKAGAFWCLGDLRQAIETAREAREFIDTSDAPAFASTLQILAYLLTLDGSHGAWQEALTIIEEAKAALRRINGSSFRLLKLRLRWIKVLAQFQLGIGSKHWRLLHQIFREFLGLGLPVQKHQVEKEMKRAHEAAEKQPLTAAAMAADLGLLGASPGLVGWAAEQARDLLPADHEMRPKLESMSRAAYRRRDLRSIALTVRSACPGVPALPPALTKAA